MFSILKFIRTYKLQAYLVSTLLLNMLLTGCASVPQSFTDGTAQYQGGNFDTAAKYFEQAAKEAPNDASIPLPLSEAHFKSAEQATNKANKINKLDLRQVIAQENSALNHVEKSLGALRVPLSKPDEGPGFIDRMKKLSDSKHQTLRDRQELQNRATVSLKTQLSQRLTTAQTSLDKILAETSRLLALNRTSPGSAYDEYVIYFPYAPYLSEVSSAKLEIEQLTIKQLEIKGLAQIEQVDYTGAELTFTRVGTILSGQKYLSAGLHAIAGHQALQKKDYETTLEKLLAIHSVHPGSAFLTTYFDKTQQLLIETKLAEVDDLIKQGKLAGMMDAFEMLSRLTKAAQGKEVFIAAIEKRNSTLRTKVAGEYLHRAAGLKKIDEMLYSSLILQNLKLASQFDPARLAELEADAAKAYAVTGRKSEMKILIAYDGSPGTNLEWAKRLENDVFTALEKSGIPNLILLDKISLKGSPVNAPGVVDLSINGEIEAVEFAESGRDTPRRRSSKYISGTRQVTNPNYAIAESAYRDAESSYQSSYSAMEKLKAQCRRLDGLLAKSFCEAGVSYISTISRDSAYAKWQGTPTLLDQNIISNYQYDYYTVKVIGLVRGKCSVADNLNRTETKCSPINVKIKLEGAITANAQATDTEGIRNAEVDVPDLGNEQESAYTKIMSAVSTELLQQVAEQRAERYCKLAESLKKPTELLNAMEAYSMCAFVTGNKVSKRRAELDTKLNGYFMITPEQAKAFGAKDSATDAVWPASAEVSDTELKLVMIKLGGHN